MPPGEPLHRERSGSHRRQETTITFDNSHHCALRLDATSLNAYGKPPWDRCLTGVVIMIRSWPDAPGPRGYAGRARWSGSSGSGGDSRLASARRHHVKVRQSGPASEAFVIMELRSHMIPERTAPADAITSASTCCCRTDPPRRPASSGHRR
jgi:hypothetical protein